MLVVDSDEDFIDEEGVTIAPVLSFQSSSVQSAGCDAEPAP
jgi:hypothetical protein